MGDVVDFKDAVIQALAETADKKGFEAAIRASDAMGEMPIGQIAMTIGYLAQWTAERFDQPLDEFLGFVRDWSHAVKKSYDDENAQTPGRPS